MSGKTDLVDGYSVIGLFSSGIFTYDPTTEDGIRYFDSGEKADLIENVGLLLTIGVLLLFIFLIFIRSNLLTMAVELDKDTYTNSDFAVIGHQMEFNDYSHEGMKAEIEDHFRQHYGIDGIEYFCPAFDIRDYYEQVETQ
jgi:hypothetical protein